MNMNISSTLRYSTHTHSTYDVYFDESRITTTVTNQQYAVDYWINEIERVHYNKLQNLIIGLDIEWRPSFSRDSTRNPVATLQLSVGCRCLIFQLLYADGIPESLYNFLNKDNYRFVGVGINEDVDKLLQDYGLDVYNVVDLRDCAVNAFENTWFKKTGLKVLAQEVLGKDIEKPKSITLSCWDDELLSLSQIQYACVDAFVCFEIGKALLV